jgi:hypothetical protein
MPGPRDNPAVPGDSLSNGASSYRIITQLVPIRSYPSVRPDLREYAQTSPPGLLDGQEPSYRYLDKVYSLARKSEDEFRGHSEMPQPETPWPYLFTREIVLRFQQDFVGDLVEISTTVLEYMQIVVGVQPNLRFRNIILEIQPPHKILQSCLLALRGACSGSLATDKDALLLQYLAFIITPTIRGLPAEHARDLSRNGLSPANPKDSLAFHTCVRALDRKLSPKNTRHYPMKQDS